MIPFSSLLWFWSGRAHHHHRDHLPPNRLIIFFMCTVYLQMLLWGQSHQKWLMWSLWSTILHLQPGPAAGMPCQTSRAQQGQEGPQSCPSDWRLSPWRKVTHKFSSNQQPCLLNQSLPLEVSLLTSYKCFFFSYMLTKISQFLLKAKNIFLGFLKVNSFIFFSPDVCVQAEHLCICWTCIVMRSARNWE